MSTSFDTEEAKYTRVEYERRFLVPPDVNWRRDVESYSKTFEDNYIRNSRLRLRILTDSDTGRRVFKLTRKSDSPSPYFRTVSRILLSPSEYKLLECLEGYRLNKTRYYHYWHGQVFSIDVFEDELAGLVLCETEADGLEDLMSAEAPPYARYEVTDDPFFDGGNLSRTTRTDLMAKLLMYK